MRQSLQDRGQPRRPQLGCRNVGTFRIGLNQTKSIQRGPIHFSLLLLLAQRRVGKPNLGFWNGP